MPMDQKTLRATRLFMEKVRGYYPAAEAMLFGSRARGDFHSESDADVAVVLPVGINSRSESVAILADMAFDVLLETGVLISALPMTDQEFAQPFNFSNPALIENIHREGLRL